MMELLIVEPLRVWEFLKTPLHHTHKHARISKEKQSNYYDLIELYKLVGEAICYRSLDRGDGAENKNSIVSMIFSTKHKRIS